MLEILQTKDKSKYKSDFEKLGINPDKLSVFEATSGDEITGYGIYHFEDDMVIVDEIKTDDLYIYDGIARAIMFLSLTKGYQKARFDVEDKKRLIDLRIVTTDNSTVNNIDDFMNNCKNCNNNR